MSAVLSAFLALLPTISQDVPAFTALWNQLKGGVAAKDQAAIDAILAALNPKLDADLTQLGADAAAQSQGAAA